MKKCLATAGVVLLVAIVLFWRLSRTETRPTPQEPQAVETATGPATQSIEPVSEQLPKPPVLEAAKPFLPIINEFAVKIRPFGVEQPVRGEDVILFRTNYRGKVLQFETASHHWWEIEDGKVSRFISFFDGTDIRQNPDAQKTWYQATAPWSKEEALQETISVLQALGKQVREHSKVEYHADPISVLDPQGRRVTVTPFHTVVLWDTNKSPYTIAEFRMGSSGPGRLTHWLNRTP